MKYSDGSSALEMSATQATSTKLIHHGERSKMANSELGAILNFIDSSY